MHARRRNRNSSAPIIAATVVLGAVAWAAFALWPRAEKIPAAAPVPAAATIPAAVSKPAEKPAVQPTKIPEKPATVSPGPITAAPAAVETSAPESCSLSDDASFCRFVGPQNAFTDQRYEPADLIAVTGAHLSMTKPATLRAASLAALQKMSDAHFRDLGRPLVVISGFRSYAYQKGIKDRGCPDSLCAKAGHSEHQTGLAVDLFAATTETEFLAVPKFAASFVWLQKNAHLYGFTNSYQNGPAVDGYEKEPWHWRHIGVELAGALQGAGQTLTQYAQGK